MNDNLSYFDYIPKELIIYTIHYTGNIINFSKTYPNFNKIIFDEYLKNYDYELYKNLLKVSKYFSLPISEILHILFANNDYIKSPYELYTKSFIEIRSIYNSRNLTNLITIYYNTILLHLKFMEKYPKIYDYYYNNPEFFKRTFEQQQKYKLNTNDIKDLEYVSLFDIYRKLNEHVNNNKLFDNDNIYVDEELFNKLIEMI